MISDAMSCPLWQAAIAGAICKARIKSSLLSQVLCPVVPASHANASGTGFEASLGTSGAEQGMQMMPL